MISLQEAKEKAAAGWFDVWVAFEGLAVNKEAVKSALEGMMSHLESDPKIKVYAKEFLEPEKVENPIKGISEAWSLVVNVNFVSKSFHDLVQVIIEYGPSAVEILGPSKKEIQINEAQDVLNNIAGMMHRYAAAGLGGMVLVRGKE